MNVHHFLAVYHAPYVTRWDYGLTLANVGYAVNW